MKIERCNVCNGRKELMGIGCMMKECHNCFGVGHVKVEDPKVDVEEKLDKLDNSVVESVNFNVLPVLIEENGFLVQTDSTQVHVNKLTTKEFTLALEANIEKEQYKPQRGRPKRA